MTRCDVDVLVPAGPGLRARARAKVCSSALLESSRVICRLDCGMSGRVCRTRAAIATLLSSLFPGMGQLYNRDWAKAAVMITLALALLIAVKAALASVLAAAGAVAMGALQMTDLERGEVWAHLLPALVHPTVQSCVRRSLLPPLIALCVLLLWSMTDAYRGGRRDAKSPTATGRAPI